MTFRHLIAAADDSEEGRAAILTSARIARLAGARVTVLSVTEPLASDARDLAHLRQVVDRQLATLPDRPDVVLAAAVGLPGIEIGRFAETSGADLVVIGRKQRTSIQRLMEGDTADSVARRSSVPCLFVPASLSRLTRVCVALDGTERGLAVLATAVSFTQAVGGRLYVVTVEPGPADESLRPAPLTGRSARIQGAIAQTRYAGSGDRAFWEDGGEDGGGLHVLRGDVVDELVGLLEARHTDVLVVGYHPGGPAGVIEAGSVSRRLVHLAPCAVLTHPL